MSVEPRSPSPASSAVALAAVLLLAGAVQLQAARERALSAGASRPKTRCTSRSGAAIRRLTRRVTTRLPPTSTGSAPSSTTAAPSAGWPPIA